MATGGSQRVSERVRRASEEAALRIVRTLRDRGFIAYLAGGCVRDVLLGLTPADYDVATSAKPEQVLEVFDDAHEVGKAFGVVLVRFRRGALGNAAGRPSPSVSVEVATFRREGVYSDNRRPDSVEFCGPEEDARRRDFTLNALFLDPLHEGPVEQQVIDTVGGLDDLRAGVIRAVGNPEARLEEDHLRALRAVRFASRFGFAIEAGTAEAIRAHARQLRGVSEERVGDELRRMLGAHMPVVSRLRAIDLLEMLMLADPVLGYPGVGEARTYVRYTLAALDAQAGFALVLLAWVHDRDGLAEVEARLAAERMGECIGTLRRMLVLSNSEIGTMKGACEGLEKLECRWAGASIAQRKRWAASSWFSDALTLLKGREAFLAERVVRERNTLAMDGIGLAPAPWISGEDLVRAGLKPGPSFGDRLARAYDAQLGGTARTAADALRVALDEGN